MNGLHCAAPHNELGRPGCCRPWASASCNRYMMRFAASSGQGRDGPDHGGKWRHRCTPNQRRRQGQGGNYVARRSAASAAATGPPLTDSGAAQGHRQQGQLALPWPCQQHLTRGSRYSSLHVARTPTHLHCMQRLQCCNDLWPFLSPHTPALTPPSASLAPAGLTLRLPASPPG